MPITSSGNPLKDSYLHRGYKKIECPVRDCKFTYKFVETNHTVGDGTITARRELYLKRCHDAGYHNESHDTAH